MDLEVEACLSRLACVRLMFLTYPPCNTPCCIKAMCSPISKSGLLISLFCTPYFGLWAFYVNQLLRCIYVGLTRNSKMMTRPRTKYRILQRSLSINNIYSVKQKPKKTRQNFRSKYKPTNWLQKDQKKRDPFNLSNIVTGNVSNETFGGKKSGTGNLVII